MVAPPLSHRNFVFEAKHELRRAEAGKSELAECGELTPAMLCELTGSQDPAPQLAGQLFDARGEIDGRTNAGEVEPIAAADIAVQDIADVQGQAEAQPGHGRAYECDYVPCAWRAAASLAMGARLLSLYGDNAAQDERAGQLIAVATEQGFPSYRAMGTIYRGWLKVNTGEVVEGISLLRSGSSAYRATGAESRIPYYIALLAKACEIAGQVDEALTLWDDALHTAERI